MQVVDASGNHVSLGEAIGRGGEGTVYRISASGDHVAKVYKTRPTAEHAAKLKGMVAGTSNELLRVAAWPITTLHSQQDRAVVGFVMRRVTGFREIHSLYGPAHRQKEFPSADWSFLIHAAMNCAGAFQTVHDHGHVVGDVNSGNVLVSKYATACLIDCDSFQITSNSMVYRCTVGVPEYTPPELQGCRFRDVQRTANHDLFGLAVLVFHLLFMGRHPFAGRFLGRGDMSLERAIRERRFAFGPQASLNKMEPPPHCLDLSSVSFSLSELFTRAFGGATATALRPSASDWHQRLTDLLASIKTCAVDPSHKYSAQLGTRCPWCKVIRSGGPLFFVSQGLRLDFSCDPTEVSALIAAVAQIKDPFASKHPPKVNPPIASLSLKHQQDAKKIAAPLAASILWFGGCLTALGVTLLLTAWACVPCVLFLLASIGALLVAYNRWRRLFGEQHRTANRRYGEAWQRHQAEERGWRKASRRFQASVTALQIEIETGRTTFRGLRGQFDNELRQLKTANHQHQRTDYLKKVFIDQHKIKNIGPARTTVLRSYGVETAYNVLHSAGGIPGFGPVLWGGLCEWARRVEQSFRFDAKKAVSEAERRKLVAKYVGQKDSTVGRMEKAVARLRQLEGSATAEVNSRMSQLQDASVQLEKAAVGWQSNKQIVKQIIPRRSMAVATCTVVCTWLVGVTFYPPSSPHVGAETTPVAVDASRLRAAEDPSTRRERQSLRKADHRGRRSRSRSRQPKQPSRRRRFRRGRAIRKSVSRPTDLGIPANSTPDSGIADSFAHDHRPWVDQKVIKPDTGATKVDKGPAGPAEIYHLID